MRHILVSYVGLFIVDFMNALTLAEVGRRSCREWLLSCLASLLTVLNGIPAVLSSMIEHKMRSTPQQNAEDKQVITRDLFGGDTRHRRYTRRTPTHSI